MANTIIVKRSSVAGKVPASGDLQIGELAVNLTDRKIYTKDSGGSVVQLGGGSGSGDVVGPASATDNALVRFDTTTGKLIQNGVITQDDNGNLALVNGVSFNTSPTSPPSTTGSMYWDSGDGTPAVVLNANTNLQLGQENVAKVYNGTGSTIAKGSVVAVSGAQGQRPSVVLADADTEALSAPTLGIAAEAIANGAEGLVCTFGFIRGIDTSGFTAGQPIYLSSTAGVFTATKPVAPQHIVALGWVIKVNASSGEIFVNINNGWELDELHNVLISSPASGNTLIYDATAGVWKNANLTAGTAISVTNGAGSITIANTGVTSLAGTASQITASASTGAVTLSLPATINVNTSGSAATLTTARTIQTDLASTSSASFNGSANITPGVTGTLPVANGGTGQTTYTNGQLLIGNTTGNTLTKATLTQGTGITITNGAGSITVTNSAPDQTVALTGAGATTVSGTYPNFTITSTNTTYSAATSTTLGLIELASDTVQSTAANAVTSTASRTYGLQVNAAGQGVVNVPWTDTTYSAATSTTPGLIELGSDTQQTVAANAVSSTASRTYALQVNAAGQGVVNVPWTDTNSGGTVTSVSAGAGMSFTTITGTGSVAMGTPGTLTTSTTNSASGTTHTHAVTFPVTSVNGQTGAVTITAGNASYDTATSSTGYFDLPAGTTAQRPGSPGNGMVRYNTTNNEYEVYGNGAWVALSTQAIGVYSVEYLVVAGGAGGACYASGGGGGGGGGGAGGYLTGTLTGLVTGNGYTVTVGAGGAGATGSKGVSGNNSVFYTITALGGGGGDNYNANGNSGGSGGGGSYSGTGGAGTSGQGNAGGNGSTWSGGGGGGAVSAGSPGVSQTSGGAGGSGSNALSAWATATSSGASGYYAGGGGGGTYSGSSGNGGSGGAGGGAAGTKSTVVPSDATANTGGGGGGGDARSSSGGSGIVIIRYAGGQRGSGGTVYTSGGYTYHKFTTSGTYTA